MSSLDINSAKVWTLTGTRSFAPDSAAAIHGNVWITKSTRKSNTSSPRSRRGQVEVCSVPLLQSRTGRIYRLVRGHKQWAARFSLTSMALYWSSKKNNECVQGVGWRRKGRRGGETGAGTGSEGRWSNQRDATGWLSSKAEPRVWRVGAVIDIENYTQWAISR